MATPGSQSGIRIGRLLGFPVFVDVSLLLIVGVLAAFNLREGPAAFASGAIFFALLLASVLWHELGHAIAVRRQHLGESIIVLHGLGGVTRYRQTPSPRQGIIVAVAGPAAGLLLGAVLYGVLYFVGTSLPEMVRNALAVGVYINVVLNLANLLPVFPLDGGQIVRFALLARMPTPRAHRATAVVGGVVLAATVAAVLYLGLGDLFIWLILAFIAAENVRLWRAASST